MPSPLLHDGVLYTVRNGGIVMSIDPSTGKTLKMARLPGAYVSSPVGTARSRALPDCHAVCHANLDGLIPSE